jgi:hypothetical protein
MLISSTRVNSKATLRVPLDALLQHVPTALRRDVARSRYLAARANALVVHADDSRKQADNAHACYRRLYDAIALAARAALPAEASPEQMQRVKSLYVHSPPWPCPCPLPFPSPPLTPSPPTITHYHLPSAN